MEPVVHNKLDTITVQGATTPQCFPITGIGKVDPKLHNLNIEKNEFCEVRKTKFQQFMSIKKYMLSLWG